MRISLYIPCFNAAGYIEEVLKAVLKQTLLPDEILIINDASTDETSYIAAKFPVKIITHRDNKGLAAGRNTAIKNIKADFIASLDADCLPEPDWLEILMRHFNSQKVAGAGGKVMERISSSVFDQWRAAHMRQYWEEGEKPVFLFGANTVFRRDALLDIGLYNESFKNNFEDVDICARLKKKKYYLNYEPKAIVWHLKRDSMESLLDGYWKWNLDYYRGKNYYRSQKSLNFKIRDNIGLANRYIEKDMISGKYQLLYLDFFLALHHSLKDFQYFIYQEDNLKYSQYSLLAAWLSLLDLTFFYHFDRDKRNISTFIPNENNFLQNFFALNLILGRFLYEKVDTEDIQIKRIIYKHLLLSICKIKDGYLVNKLLILIKSHNEWSRLYKNKQANLNSLFLKSLYVNLNKWMDSLKFNLPGIIRMIKTSAELTDEQTG